MRYLLSLLLAARLAAQGFMPGGQTAAASIEGNIYDQSFNSGFGSTFNDGSGNTLGSAGYAGTQGSNYILDNTNSEIGSPWTQSARADLTENTTCPYSGQVNNLGLAIIYGNLSPDNLVGSSATMDANPVTKLYVRVAYKQANPFNACSTQGSNVPNDLKFIRFYEPGISSQRMSIFVSQSAQGYIDMFFDGYDANDDWSANCNGGTSNTNVNLNNNLGSWLWYEAYLDVSNDAHHVIGKLWINGVLVAYHDAAFQDSTGNSNYCGPSQRANTNFSPGTGQTIGDVQVAGTINTMMNQVTTNSYWVQQIGFGTNGPLGVPTRSYP